MGDPSAAQAMSAPSLSVITVCPLIDQRVVDPALLRRAFMMGRTSRLACATLDQEVITDLIFQIIVRGFDGPIRVGLHDVEAVCARRRYYSFVDGYVRVPRCCLFQAICLPTGVATFLGSLLCPKHTPRPAVACVSPLRVQDSSVKVMVSGRLRTLGSRSWPVPVFLYLLTKILGCSCMTTWQLMNGSILVQSGDVRQMRI